jgi:hypothetical protein
MRRAAVVAVLAAGLLPGPAQARPVADAGAPATGTLSVCALSETPAFWGQLFSFSVEGGPLVSTQASQADADPSTWSCLPLGTFAAGTRVTVQERVPAGTEVAWIDADPAPSLVDFDLDAATAVVKVAGGATRVLFDDEPLPPPQTGFVEVCADRALLGAGSDPAVLGPLTYTVTPPDGAAFDVTVAAGQCSGAYAVHAGLVHVVQRPVANHTVVDAFTVPAGRLEAADVGSGSADVDVPVSASPNDETQLHLVVRRDRAQLTVCMTLGVASGALDGATFTLDVIDLDGGAAPSLGIEVLARARTAQCRVVGDYPVGDRVDVEERDPGPDVTTTGGGASVIARGINTVSVANTAWGRLSVCVAPVGGLTTPPVLRFRIDGGPLLPVRGGTCSLSTHVSVGNHVVAQIVDPLLELDPAIGISTLPADREVAKLPAALRLTIAAPFGSETSALFASRIRRATIEVCAQVAPGSEDALGRKLFRFTVTPAAGPPFTPTVAAGACSLPSSPYRVLAADGTPATVTVTEATGPWAVQSIALTGGRDLRVNCGPAVCSRTALFTPAPGVDVVTYTNRAGLPATSVP